MQPYNNISKEKPKVSVLMIAYNADRYIDTAITSICNQTFTDFELIIIDDGSTDNTKKIIQHHMKRDVRIQCFSNIVNTGIVAARNTSLSKARGQYIAILDTDDISLPHRLEKSVFFLDNNPDIFLVCGGAELCDKDGIAIRKVLTCTDENILKSRLERKNTIFHSSIMFRNKGYRYRDKFFLAEDYDFYLQAMLKKERIRAVDEYLIKYRMSDGSSSFANQAKTRLCMEKANELYLQEKYNHKDLYTEFNPQDILNLDINTSTDRVVLSSIIRVSFVFHNYKVAREFCKKYFTHYGYINKYILYYVATYIGKHIHMFFLKKAPESMLRFLNRT